MKKLILIASMLVVIVAQVFVISRFFIDRFSIVLGGDKVKFLVSDFDLSTAREDTYIKINLAKEISGEGEYGILRVNDGFVELDRVALEKPNFGMYVKSSEKGYFKFPVDKYYIKSLSKKHEELEVTENTKAYIVVKIKDGEIQVVDFMIDGVPVEEYIK